LRYIDEPAIAAVLRMQDLIPAMRRAMIDYSGGRVAQPARRIVEVKPHGGYFGAMPAAGASAVGAKLVSFYPGNGARKLHTHMAVIVLFRPETGEPLVMMDGRLITEMRTAAVTAAFVDAVAAPSVRSLAVLGAGVQAASHIEALASVRRFDDIRIWNRTPERARRLAAETGARALDREEAVRGADVVVVATASGEPVLDGRWLKPGAKVASVGWSGADGAELDAATMANLLIVDSREGTQIESGNVRRYAPRIHAELGEVLAGTATVDAAATVVFDSIGMACQDIGAAALVYELLAKQGKV
jgi:ornithine cyclodeaminase/alanine dehydrogenase-like protein (mu-crystallin family)